MVMEFSSINRLDLTEQTYRLLRERILIRQIRPGEKILVEEIARGLGVSRTPVVNALKVLQSDGLVEVVPRRGTFVTEITARDIAELFEVRLMIELYAIHQVYQSHRIGDLLEELRQPFERMSSSVTEEDYVDYDTFISGDHDLHALLVKAVGNQRLSHIYSDLNIHMQIARMHYLNTVEKAREAQAEHKALISALENRDLESLKNAVTVHINNVKERMLELLQEGGGRL